MYVSTNKYSLNILMIFSIKEKDNVDPYNVFLAIATDLPVLLWSRVIYDVFIYNKCIE